MCAWLWPGRPRLLPAGRKSAAENYSSLITNTDCIRLREAYISRSSVVVSGLTSISIIGFGVFFLFFSRSVSKCFLLIFCKRNLVCDGGSLYDGNKTCFKSKNVYMQSVSFNS